MYRSLLLSFLLTACSLSADGSDIRLHYSEGLEIPEGCVFIPPAGWLAADRSQFPENMLAMVVGKGKGPYPPSINIWIEPYRGTQKSYLKCIKETCLSEKDEFRDLGQIATASGNAALCQVDRKTKWGEERLLHALIVRYDKAYLLTAAALKEEFADHYSQFFEAIRSMKINKSVSELSPKNEAQN